MNFDAFADYYYTGSEERYPNISYLVSQSVRFTSCYTSVPSITVPMQTAIVTGAKSGVTGNCYQYFDKKECRVIKTGRTCNAETVAELFRDNGLSVLSIQQFAVENHGCTREDPDHLYVQPEKDYSVRFDMLIRYLKEKKILSFSFEKLHDAILFYIDDIDTDGHNHHAPFVATEEERVEKVRRKMDLIDVRVGELIETMKEIGIWDDTTILLTADHGMIGFDKPTRFPWLCREMERITGLKATLLEEEAGKSGIFMTSNSIQAQVFFMEDGVDEEHLKKELLKLPYVEKVMTRAELDEEGVDERYADMVVSPKENHAFYVPTELPDGIRFASHDSLSEMAQHVFAVIKHPGEKSRVVDKRIQVTDLMPTCLSLMGMPPLRNQTGEAQI